MIRIFTVEKKSEAWHVKDEEGNSMTKHGSADAAIESLSYDYFIHHISHISDKVIALAVEPDKETSFNGWCVIDIEDAAYDMDIKMTDEQLFDARVWLENHFDPSKGTGMADIEEAIRIFSKIEKETKQ